MIVFLFLAVADSVEEEGPGKWALMFLVLILMLLAGLIGYVIHITSENKRLEEETQQQGQQQQNIHGRARARTSARRSTSAALRRRVRNRRRSGIDDDDDDDDDGENDEEHTRRDSNTVGEGDVDGVGDEGFSDDGDGEEGENATHSNSRRARLERYKAEKRAYKEEEKRRAEAEREQRRQRDAGEAGPDKGAASKYEEKRRVREEERERQEKEIAEQEQKEEEERQRREDEEAAKWMSMFEIEVDGSAEQDMAQESQGLLAEFVEYIKKKKAIVLEDAAAEFGMRTQDVINRIQGLEAMGRLTGVMDERGKYIYISVEEMEKVAAYIQKVGRISIASLSQKVNDIVDLAPDE